MSSAKKDTDMLMEAYEQVLEEGLFDRFKARGAQAIGAVKGAGQQVAGGAKQLAGKAISKAGDYAQKGVEAVGGSVDPGKNKLTQAGANLQKTGAKQVGAGQRAGEEAKYRSYISNTVQTLITDLTKLGMAVNDEAALSKELTDVITKNLKQVTKSGQLRTAAGTMGSKVV
jgi:hypothetical protein